MIVSLVKDQDYPEDPCYNDPRYLEWCEERAAIREGRATELMRCYLCVPDGIRMQYIGTNEIYDIGPLRGVVKRTVVERHRDPTQVVWLTCGHGMM